MNRIGTGKVGLRMRIQILKLGFEVLVLSILLGAFSSQLSAQEDSGWRISPERMNLLLGDERPLQILDDSATDLKGAKWPVDDADRGELREEDGRVVLHAKAVGKIRVTAILGGETRFQDIEIWAGPQLPPGTTNWGTHPIGRDIRDLPAVPTPDSPHMFSLEQTEAGSSYLRAFSEDGIQVWNWLVPDGTRDVELVCGDWLGGAVISTNQPDSYTLYFVGKDGKLRWQLATPGLRKGLAINTDNMLYLLSQSADRKYASFRAFDESSGLKKFELPLPASLERQIGVEKQGTTFSCASNSVANTLRIMTSGVYVSMDGYPYVAFTERIRTVGVRKCTAGSVVNANELYLDRDDKLILWQVHLDGTHRSIVVEETKNEQPLSATVYTVSPTDGIVTDNMNGMLVPTRLSDELDSDEGNGAGGDVIYRVAQDGSVVYRLPLPKYSGPLHDGMVIASNDLGFATRGGVLIAFNVRTGKDLWHWESNTDEISVFAALADGSCLVQTASALVDVTSSTESREVVKGKATMDWQGRIYVQSK
jgi:outer membrane protein assembly factor BamB